MGEIIKAYSGRILGYCKASQKCTADYCGRIIALGDITAALA